MLTQPVGPGICLRSSLPDSLYFDRPISGYFPAGMTTAVPGTPEPVIGILTMMQN
jgi:hypothetical protein